MTQKNWSNMNNGIVIADSGPIFSLAIINQLHLFDSIFQEVLIPKAVWEEITYNENNSIYRVVYSYFKDKVKEIAGLNRFTYELDYGESEAVILFEEMQANILLIDDKKARTFAENLGIKCIETLGLLSIAKDKGLIDNLRSFFIAFLQNNRYYSLDILNNILIVKGEEKISI